MPLGLPPVPALKQITTIIIQKVEKKSNEHRRFNRNSCCNIQTVHRHGSLAGVILAGTGCHIPVPTTEDPAEEEKQSPTQIPRRKRKKRWQIADEMACSEASVSMILKEEK